MKLFSGPLLFVYHCFDRIVINGYLSGLSRPDQAVDFFSPDHWRANRKQGKAHPAYERLPELGGSLNRISELFGVRLTKHSAASWAPSSRSLFCYSFFHKRLCGLG